MRIPIQFGVAVGCLALVVGQQALSGTGSGPYRLPDPGLIVLEKLGARAKKAMEAFVLRPRMPDAYDLVCSSCMQKEPRVPLSRIARATISEPPEKDAAFQVEAPRRSKLRYASFSQSDYGRRTTRLGRKLSSRARHGQRGTRLAVISDAAEAWEVELRR